MAVCKTVSRTITYSARTGWIGPEVPWQLVLVVSCYVFVAVVRGGVVAMLCCLRVLPRRPAVQATRCCDAAVKFHVSPPPKSPRPEKGRCACGAARCIHATCSVSRRRPRSARFRSLGNRHHHRVPAQTPVCRSTGSPRRSLTPTRKHTTGHAGATETAPIPKRMPKKRLTLEVMLEMDPTAPAPAELISEEGADNGRPTRRRALGNHGLVGESELEVALVTRRPAAPEVLRREAGGRSTGSCARRVVPSCCGRSPVGGGGATVSQQRARR